MAKATAILHKKGDGPLYPIYLRISDRQRRTYQSTNFEIQEKQWDKKTRQVKNHPKAAVINAWLNARIAELQSEIVIEGKKSFEKESDVLFIEVTSAFFRANEPVLKPDTLRHYRSEITKLTGHATPKYINQITPSWLEDYELYMRNELKNTQNTVWKSMKFLRTLLTFAVKKEFVKVDPFLKYQRPVYKQTERKFLTVDEVGDIQNALNEGKYKDTVYDCAVWFLLSCYTGLRMGDISGFSSDKIKNGRIVLYTQKTGEPVSIKINDNLANIIKLSKTCERFAPQWTNKALKSVGHIAKIKRPLSFHMARHTFAVRCADLGLSQEVTGRLLGHTNLKTTAIYYKITNKRIDDEMDKFSF